MAEIDPVILQLRADVAKYNADVQQTARRVTAHLDRQERSVVSLENQFRRSSAGIASSLGSISRVASAFGAALGGISAVALARGLLQMADEAKNLDAQLRLATAQSGSFAQAQEDVRRIADSTRTGLKDTADLYGAFARNAHELGISQAQVARITETVSQTFRISGATTAETAGATRQLIQAFQSGVLRGEEFNSVMENAPRLARLLAESLGVPVGSLRAMAEEGKITADMLARAFSDTRFTDGIDAEFRQLPVTFDQAMTTLYNSAVITFGAFDQGGEFSTALANFITQGSGGFEGLADDARALGTDIRSTMAGLSDVFTPMLNGAMEAFGLISTETKSLSQQISNLFGEFDAITNWAAKHDLTRYGMMLGGNAGAANFVQPYGGGTNYQQTFDRGQQQKQNELRRRAGEQSLRDSMQRRDAMGNLIDAGPTPSSTPSSSTGGGKKKTGGRTPRSPLNPEAFAREEAQLNDQILRLKADEVTNADERAMAELKRLEAANLAATTEVQGDKRYTDAQKAQIIALMGTANALQQAKVLAERDVIATRDALDIRMSGLRDQQDLLRSDADMATTRSERRDIELRLLDLAYEQERAELDAIIASKDASDAQKQIAESRLRILGALQAGEAEGINRRSESPLARYKRDIAEVGANRNDEYEQFAVDGLQSLNDGLTDAIMNAKSFGDVFSNVAKQVIADMIRMAIQQTIVNSLIGGISGMLGGGGGAIGGGAKSIANFKGARAAGGPVTAGGTYLVGENGPELFTPPRSGTIVPNHAINTSAAASMAGVTAVGRAAPTVVTQVMKFDLTGAVMTPDLLAQMNQMAQAAAFGGAMAGSNQAQTAIAQKGRRRIPGR